MFELFIIQYTDYSIYDYLFRKNRSSKIVFDYSIDFVFLVFGFSRTLKQI